jgi:hypothetical protein
MVNEDILGGIEKGVEKGETLEYAMMSFYNAGYQREDIEWAAKAFQMQDIAKRTQWSAEPFKREEKKEATSDKNLQIETNQFIKKPTKVIQNVSNYGASQFREKVILVVLISSFLALLAILAGIFLFRTQVVDFFNSLFA